MNSQKTFMSEGGRICTFQDKSTLTNKSVRPKRSKTSNKNFKITVQVKLLLKTHFLIKMSLNRIKITLEKSSILS